MSVAFWFLLVTTALLGIYTQSLQRQLSVLKERVRLLETATGNDPVNDPIFAAEISDMLRKGRKMDAIKRYQTVSLGSAADARRAVEALELKTDRTARN